MAQPLRDLEPRCDPRGGSPRTPIPPITQAEYQQYSVPVNGSGVFKVIAAAEFTLLLGLIGMWWTALQNKGINQNELREFMRDYKQSISEHVTAVDTQIGELKGRQDQILSRLSKVEFQQVTDGRDFTEFKAKTEKRNDLVADYLESQKTKK